MKNPLRNTAVLAATVLASPAWAAAVTSAPGEVGNDFVVVKAAGGTVTIAGRADGKVFARDGKLDGAGPTTVREEIALDPGFGKGRCLIFDRKGDDGTGGEIALEVYPDLPFALVRETVKNTTAKAVDLQKVVPATFTLDLGRDAAQLKTLGTGGLLAPDKNPGSYLFLTCADPATREGVVGGWVTQFKGSGSVFSAVDNGAVKFQAQSEHGHLILQPGQSAKLDTFAIGHFKDARLGEEALASAIAKAHHIKLRSKEAVYCSWYAEGKDHGGAGTAENSVELARFIAKEKLNHYGLGVIQIDDRWQDGPQIGGPATHFDRVDPKGPYANGIAPVAKEVEAQGLTFGLWWLPFGRNHMEADFKDKQDWFFKKTDATPLRQKSFGGTCLDSSVPAVAEHLETLGHTIRQWGVKYYKMDGLNAGVGVDHCYINDGYKNDGFGNSLPAHDQSLTNIEVMRKGLGHIRKGAGDDVFFSGCCAVQNMRTYAGTIGLVDSMRVGPDFNHDGQGIRSGPLRGSRLYFLNGRLWWNDPDPTKLRTSTEGCDADHSIDGAVSLSQAQMTSSWVSLADQFFLISDWLPNLPPERLDILRRTMASHGATTRPVDHFDHELANTWLVSDEKSGVRRDVIGIFNYYDKPLKVDYSFAKTGLDPAKSYHAFDFWSNQPVADLTDSVTQELAPNSCRVLSLRAKEDHPVLVSTSRHVSSGILEVKQEAWADGALTGTSEVVGGDTYELRIVGLRDGGKQWVPSQVIVSNEDKAAGVTVSHTLEAGLLRVKIVSPKNRPVHWRAGFTEDALQPERAKNFKASAPSAYQPVTLSWESNAMFHTLSRDGQVVSTSLNGQSCLDLDAAPGKTHTYILAVDGGAPLPPIQVAVPDYPPVPQAPDVKLAGLKPLAAQIGYGEAQSGKAIDGAPLTAGGKVSADGIGLHANALFTYARDPQWKRFVAHIGLNETQRKDGRGSIVCKVISESASGAKSVLTASPVMRFGAIERFPVDVALPADCAKVHLVVEDAGDGIACDHANWCDAGFVLK
ncbi:MAG: NPCBM/NEW2 domain-containing protein [Luteolibacter sp.]